MYSTNSKKYKINNSNEQIINFQHVDKTIDNLENYYGIFKQLAGGRKNKKEDSYLTKYKKLIKMILK